jgi:hypothetical protein
VVAYDEPIGPRLNTYRALNEPVTAMEPTATIDGALWDGRASAGHALSSGVYFAVLERGGVRASRCVVMAR